MPLHSAILQSLLRWFDTGSSDNGTEAGARDRIDWLRTVPFIALHVAVLLVFVVGWSPAAITMAVAMYLLRMFAITGFYHRYFSHQAFHTSRAMQFVFALIGASSAQRGPLWWAAHHRLHHLMSDSNEDIHSPARRGFLWSHMGWFLSRSNFSTRVEHVRDLATYPELRFLDRFDILVPALLAMAMFLTGETLNHFYPELGTNGMQMLVWGFVISTVTLYHITFSINSIAHTRGHRRFATPDNSRNNFILALLTLGEGWHNNHHYYPASARQGFAWWEIDITYYLLRLMQSLGLIRDLRPVPAHVMKRRSKQPIKTPARATS